MPSRGFKVGDEVYTPSMRKATVVAVSNPPGPERVTIRYDEGPFPNRTFRAEALRWRDRSR